MVKKERFSGIGGLEGMSKEELEDALALARFEILDKVKKLSEGWKALMELNMKSEMIQIRLECFREKPKEK